MNRKFVLSPREGFDMLALFQIVALCAAADGAPVVGLCGAAEEAPSYTVHIRKFKAPERAIRVQLTGSVAVMDAVEALPRQSRELGRKDMWIERRTAGGRSRILPIDWTALSQGGTPSTNYIILAGDRLFLQARPAR
jgi:hypothetical protein